MSLQMAIMALCDIGSVKDITELCRLLSVEVIQGVLSSISHQILKNYLDKNK